MSSITRRQIIAGAAATAAVAAMPAVAIGAVEAVPDLYPGLDAWNASPQRQSDWKWMEFMADLGDEEIKKILRISKIDDETLDDVLCDGLPIQSHNHVRRAVQSQCTVSTLENA